MFYHLHYNIVQGYMRAELKHDAIINIRIKASMLSNEYADLEPF